MYRKYLHFPLYTADQDPSLHKSIISPPPAPQACLWAPSGKELELVSVINRDTRLECLHKTPRRGKTVHFFVYMQLRARLARLVSKIPENTLFL